MKPLLCTNICMYPFDCVSLTIGGISLKIHIFHSKHMCYRQYKNGLYRSIIKSSLLAEHCAFPAVSRQALQGFSWIFIQVSFARRTCATTNVSLGPIKATLLQQQWTSSAVSRLALEGFSWKFTSGTSTFSSTEVSLVVKGTLLGKQFTFWTVDCISPKIAATYLKIQISYFMHIRYKWLQFGYDR